MTSAFLLALGAFRLWVGRGALHRATATAPPRRSGANPTVPGWAAQARPCRRRRERPGAEVGCDRGASTAAGAPPIRAKHRGGPDPQQGSCLRKAGGGVRSVPTQPCRAKQQCAWMGWAVPASGGGRPPNYSLKVDFSETVVYNFSLKPYL